MKQQIAILIIFMVSLHCKEKQLPIQADKAEITSIQASSSLKDAKDKYNVNHLRDKSNKSWCEGNADIGIGERITIVYNNPQKVLVENLYIKNGYGDTKYYSLNGRVKEFKILVDDKEMVGKWASGLWSKSIGYISLVLMTVAAVGAIYSMFV
jgi:hypothetical protein